MNDPFVQQLLIAIESALSDIKVDYDLQWGVWQVVCGAGKTDSSCVRTRLL